ncbi:MAG: gamma-glutamyltransferase [candidate division Zixibacteria bacterium]|nr:gamma-glutamyltransferase [candidate division Zixibacteria bacterium]
MAAAFLLALLPFFISGCDNASFTSYYEKGALATASPIATQIGEQVFAKGGNAFDVAVAVGFALAVVHPEAGNIGGGGFAVIRDASTKEIKALDFREKAPLASSEKMYLDSMGNPIENMSTVGADACGVPGTVAGLYELWKEHGSMKWSELISYAILLADSGFMVNSYQAESFNKYRDRLSVFDESSRLFYPNANIWQEGDTFVNRDLGWTLVQLEKDGLESFYAGEIADSIVATVKRYGGLISHEDLASYQIKWRKPVSFTFDSLQIYAMPPPSSGGLIMGQILKLVEAYDFSIYKPGSIEYIHLFCESARLAFADRSEYLGDPDFYNIPFDLLDKNYISERRQLINLNQTNSSLEILPGSIPIPESGQTTHYSVVDAEGNMVAVTYTLNSSYGSKLAVNGCGFLLNNEMDDFAIAPGVPNLYGLVGGEANKIEPAKRMLSSMSPTIILKGGEPLFILGSPGGSQIITAVTQVIVSLSRFNLPLEKALSQPRFHHQWLPDNILLEEKSFDINVKQGLLKLGHIIKEADMLSEIHAVYIDGAGLMSATADRRGPGSAGGQ